jgi:hypothetical protein
MLMIGFFFLTIADDEVHWNTDQLVDDCADQLPPPPPLLFSTHSPDLSADGFGVFCIMPEPGTFSTTSGLETLTDGFDFGSNNLPNEPVFKPVLENDAPRQLSTLLQDLYQTDLGMPSRTDCTNMPHAHTNKAGIAGLQLMDSTVKSAHSLLNIVDSLDVQVHQMTPTAANTFTSPFPSPPATTSTSTSAPRQPDGLDNRTASTPASSSSSRHATHVSWKPATS